MGRDKYETNEYVTKRIFGQDHIFHIVSDNFPIIEDGIIGLPCLGKYNYSISNDKIRLNDKTILFQKPIHLTPGVLVTRGDRPSPRGVNPRSAPVHQIPP